MTNLHFFYRYRLTEEFKSREASNVTQMDKVGFRPILVFNAVFNNLRKTMHR